MKFRSGLAGVVVSICLLVLIAMSVSCEEWWYAEVEENDSPQTATPIPSENKISGRISEYGDLDYFYDIVYGGRTYTYTIKDMTDNLQLMLYEKVDDFWEVNIEVGAVDNEPGAGSESFVYTPTVTQVEICVLVQESSSPPAGKISSYWLVKSVE